MIAEKPSWIRHEGMQIFSIDIQPGGLRFATGGGDHKVRIWNMKCVGRDLEADESISKLLATLRDHFGSVNCVRWAKHGRYIASGSDDQVIQVHERKPGSGTTEFGSGEPPDVENWKVTMTLRGHTADVVDLNWSPDDSTLASGSLDNTIHIWNMSNGVCSAVLRGHSSLVKGVTWDPIGSFIASQSDDKTVIIWRTSDWSLAHRTEGHWAKSLGSTFFRRLGWSPCGHYITTTHGFQKPRHSAPVLERGEWSATFDFLGHNAPVIVVKFNHSMFRRNLANAQEVKNAALGWANGSSKSGGKESQPYNVIAIGSQDRTITVWTTASPRPLFVAKHFFSQSVVDLSWSPDGYSLFACSLDGSVATYHFDGNELGQKLSDAELDELKRNRYGDVRGRQANLAESPAQLLLEAAAAKQTSSKKITTDLTQVQATSKSSADLGSVMKIPKPQSGNGKKTEGVNNDSLTKPAASTHLSSPVKQREYRRPDGRKRIIPEAVGFSPQQENTSGIAQSPAIEFPNTVDQRKGENGMVLYDASVREGFARKTFSVSADQKERSGVTARATISESLIIEKVPPSAGKDGSISVEQMGIVKDPSHLGTGGALLIRVFDNKEGEDTGPICLQAQPREQAANDNLGIGNSFVTKETEILCTRGAQTLWSDRISGKVTVLAGNANFWAVGCEDGCIQIYTKCGRRAMPTMMMGSAAVFVDCDESWKFLLVTRKGSLHLWDLFNRKCLLQDSLASLMTSDPKANAGTIKVITAKLSKSGFPLVVLATRHAYLFDMGLMCWLRVADDCFPASNFSSSWSSGSLHGGELAALQVDVKKFLARRPGWSRVTDDGVQTRAHLEAQLASALALKSPSEYHQCLLSYVRFLAREADESRLREVCENFLGPPTGMAEAACPVFPYSPLSLEPHLLSTQTDSLSLSHLSIFLSGLVHFLPPYQNLHQWICIADHLILRGFFHWCSKTLVFHKMAHMQRDRSILDSFPENIDLNQGSVSNNASMDMTAPWNSFRNPVENRLSNPMLSPARRTPSYVNGVNYNAQSFSGWDQGESSSTANLHDRTRGSDLKIGQGWTSSSNDYVMINPRSERRFEPSSVLSTSGYGGNHLIGRPPSVSSNLTLDHSPVNANLSGGYNDDDGCLVMRTSVPPVLFKSDRSEVVRPQAFGASDNSGTFTGGSSSSNAGPEKIVQHNHPSSNDSTSSLNILPHSSNMQNVGYLENTYPRNGVGTSMYASDVFPPSSAGGIAESSARNFGAIANLVNRDLITSGLLPIGTTVGHSSVSPAHVTPGPSSVTSSLDTRRPFSPPMSSGNHRSQSHMMNVPGLSRGFHSLPWDASPSSRGGSSSMIPGDRGASLGDETNFSTIRNNGESHPFVPVPETRNMVLDPTNWSLATANASSSRNSPSSAVGPGSRVRSSTAWTHGLPEFAPWVLFPSGEPESGNQRGHSSMLPSAASSSEEPVMSSRHISRGNRQPHLRSSLMVDPGEDVDGWRALAVDVQGRHRLIRQVLNAMRRVENLRSEDYMLVDPFINGIAEFHDRHRAMRLDVDNMSYEELLALEEHIGNVNTGLSEETILVNLKQQKHGSVHGQSSSNLEPCCICQEEYTAGDIMGMLDCGHEFHTNCIKQWLVLKNTCPICKMTALET